MYRTLLLVLVIALGINFRAEAEEQPVTYYIQLIRGTTQSAPQNSTWHAIGPRLSEQLSPVFRWNHYWEVDRKTASVERGKVKKIQLNKERTVEIELVKPTVSEIRLYLNGNLVRVSRQSIQSGISIMGGDRETDESWFVVVRRDKPS